MDHHHFRSLHGLTRKSPSTTKTAPPSQLFRPYNQQKRVKNRAMAAASKSPSSLPIMSLLLISSLSLSSSLSPIFNRQKLGGRTEVRNVGSNQEIQSLGRFSVEEYNKIHQRHLSFSRVFKAEKQVVSGIKYFLKIETGDASEKGFSEQFDAIVVVKPWIRSKELLSFSPTKHY